ncbi:MAG: dihydrofolate reductase, partial [Bacteroidales bacterium]|nr:dihydrofolate reductase [Bacteroidales bacterium]
QLLPYADRLYLTEVLAEFEADTFFPAVPPADWRKTAESEVFEDEKSGLKYRFVDYERRRTA